MKRWIFASVLTLLLGTSAFAQTASDALAGFDHNVYASLGFSPGGVAFGLEYEYPFHRTYGIGGFLHMQQKDDDKLAQGVTSFGAFIRPHFVRRAWDLYLAPGFGVAMIDGFPAPLQGDETGIGPTLDLGLMYQITDNIAVGAELFQHHVWFGSDWQGYAVMSTYSAKFRFGF